MRFTSDLVVGKFFTRLNRFVAEVEIDGKTELAHIPNTGRMRELLIEGNLSGLTARNGTGRKTRFDLVMIKHNNNWVAIDSRLANTLFAEGWQGKLYSALASDFRLEKEVLYKGSRLDFKSVGPIGNTLVEVKSVNLVKEEVAMFPDAPTQRGSRHLSLLAEAKYEGMNAAVFFMVMRSDAKSFTPHKNMDKEFARQVEKALKQGVTVQAYTCRVGLDGIFLHKEIPVEL
jgi:sugar fermentation stimulation protein A